jgi:hypothetical protein
VLNEPAKHCEHADAPRMLYVPATQERHELPEVPAALGLNLPALHGKHISLDVMPVLGLTVPGAHAVQDAVAPAATEAP